MKLCLPIAMCGPFCSLEPTKMIAVVSPAAMASRTSVQVRSSIQTERCCALAGIAPTVASAKAAITATSHCGVFTGASDESNQSQHRRGVSTLKARALKLVHNMKKPALNFLKKNENGLEILA